jgi:hypothetical protein
MTKAIAGVAAGALLLGGGLLMARPAQAMDGCGYGYGWNPYLGQCVSLMAPQPVVVHQPVLVPQPVVHYGGYPYGVYPVRGVWGAPYGSVRRGHRPSIQVVF